MKTCRKCGQAKPIREYYGDTTAKDGLRPSCKSCWIAASLTYNRSHPEVTKRAKRKHHVKNRERDNADARARHRLWREANREAHRARSKAWYRNNREKALAALAQRTRGLAPLDAASQEYASVLRSDPCCYCGGTTEDIDHIEPIVSGGSNHWTNLTAACGLCNNRKYSFPLLLFLARR